jgi:pimeloyl-ACP methyl ester carboxylesterase
LPLPAVLWFHGLGADKDVHRFELRRFADAGLLAIGVDAVGHGQRRMADFEQPFPASPAASPQLFNGFVKRTVAELPELINRFRVPDLGGV